MRFRLLKLQIQNFKGIAGTHVVEFGSSSTLLSGPNGYGKTTIFDALELSLTGEVARIERDNNERGSKTHESTVFHHSKDKPVILRLHVWANEKEHTIVRRFPESKEKLSLGAYKDELETYLLDDFDSALEDAQATTQESLEGKLFGAENEKYLSKYYRLLSYSPQSEAIHFLKMKQLDRHTELSPLLDMTSEITFNEEFKSYRKDLFRLRKHLEEKIEEYSGITGSEKIDKFKYARITHSDEIPEYDEEKPFADLVVSVAKEKRDRINESLQDLADFLGTFKPPEYAKEKSNNQIRKIMENDFSLNYLLFKDVLKQPESINELENRNRLLNLTKSTTLAEKYIYQIHLEKEEFDKLSESNKRYRKYYSVLYDSDGNLKNTKQILLTLSDFKNKFNTDTQQTASDYLVQYRALESNISSSNKLLQEIQLYRKRLTEHAQHKDNVMKGSDCPLCGFEWQNSKSLFDAIEEKSFNIQKLTGQEAKRLDTLEKTIKTDFIDDLTKRAAKFLEENKEASDFFSSIEHLGILNSEEKQSISVLTKSVPEIAEYIHTNKIIHEDIRDAKNQVVELISAKLAYVDQEILKEIRKVMSYDFSETQARLDSVKLQLSKSKITNKDIPGLDLDKLEALADEYRKEFNSYLEANKVKSEDIENQQLFTKLFKERADLFETAKKEITNKSKYIEQQFYASSIEKFNLYKKQYEMILPLSKKAYDLSHDYESAIRKYQFGLTQPLKIPFYIYSAKILQSTPSGHGVFIKTEPNKNTIVFCTSPDTSHDALHQLSSGQLAVVSMAFTLSMNAVYSDKSLKLLVIDDPIQDMDVLNVHSFSELLRREFMNDTQVIMSTHDDLDMQYLKFMFDKSSNGEDIKALNVQELFYSKG
jgi:exonuclease SbcC